MIKHMLSTPMIVSSLNVNKDHFCSRENDEEPLGSKEPYLSSIGALMCLANNTQPDITFVVNLLEIFSSFSAKRSRNGVRHIFTYFRRTIDMGLFYSNESSKFQLVSYHTHIRIDLKSVTYLHVMVQLYHGV